jgi:hypothetical protein
VSGKDESGKYVCVRTEIYAVFYSALYTTLFFLFHFLIYIFYFPPFQRTISCNVLSFWVSLLFRSFFSIFLYSFLF